MLLAAQAASLLPSGHYIASKERVRVKVQTMAPEPQPQNRLIGNVLVADEFERRLRQDPILRNTALIAPLEVRP